MRAVQVKDKSEAAAVVTTEKVGFVFSGGGGVIRSVAEGSTRFFENARRDIFTNRAIVSVEIAVAGGEVRLALESSRDTVVMLTIIP